MHDPQRRRGPGSVGALAEAESRKQHRESITASGRHRKTHARLPENWRERLPDPADYYAQHVVKLGRANAKGWAQGACPFHDDHEASLSVHVAGGGGWRCFAGCGSGDLVSFHQRRSGLGFPDAVRDLLGRARA